jgi:hypothetical protein
MLALDRAVGQFRVKILKPNEAFAPIRVPIAEDVVPALVGSHPRRPRDGGAAEGRRRQAAGLSLRAPLLRHGPRARAVEPEIRKILMRHSTVVTDPVRISTHVRASHRLARDPRQARREHMRELLAERPQAVGLRLGGRPPRTSREK